MWVFRSLCTPWMLKVFPGRVGERDYSGFERRGWKRRTNAEHRKSVRRILNAKNVTEQNKLETEFGCR